MTGEGTVSRLRGAGRRLLCRRSLGKIRPMKILPVLAATLLASAACEKAQSKLDSVTEQAPQGGGVSGDLEARVARLERYTEALNFLQQVYNQQKQQREAQEANEPDDEAVFAVDTRAAVAAGQVEGPTAPMVTIIEAWDFA